MAAVRTFVVADVLIWAARGLEALSSAALDVLAQPNREFIASDFLRLEVIPKAAYHRQTAEEAFYRRYFDAVNVWCESSPTLLARAEKLATRYGLSAVDPLHVAAATIANAEQLVTAERPTSPLFRVQDVRVVSIRPAAGIV